MQKETKTRKTTKLKANNTIDMPLLISVLILLALGIVMVLSASAPSALAEYGDSYKFVKTQGIAAGLGIFAMIVLTKIDYRIYKRYYKAIYVLSILVLFTVLIPGIGSSSNGARRWIQISFIGIQPSEITKIGLIIAYAGYFTDPKNKLDTIVGNTVIPIVGLLIPVGILLIVQNHMSSGVVLSIVTVIIIMMSGCTLKYYAGLMCAGVVGALAMLPFIKDKLIGGFRSDRIEAWLHPLENSSGTSYQTMQGLYAIGSGGLFGNGLGQSKQKYLYIPEAHNICNISRGIRICRMLTYTSTFYSIYSKRNTNFYKSKRYVWKSYSSRNNITNRSAGNFKYSSCNQYYT